MSTTPENIYLLGFMGSGKSQLGRMLARHLGRHFVDTDTQVELGQGLTVAEIFRRFGDARFRELELQALEQVAGRQGQVVALGGGTPLRERAWQMIASSGASIYIKRSPQQLSLHLQGAADRPLLRGIAAPDLPGYIAELLKEREKWYTRADYILECEDGWTREQTFRALVQMLAETS